ncbi:DUF3891 family protein [Aquimarina sp. ERC-38]|uniref:DUF3891 family protein n=1 Tax=Aquimarina sp. ERC-38 TaxID=2949996 RepID=UPI002248035C|nr:DUF3891 family protein [Aquimarina sp. ERC-38]UZO81156.1 DUF3891 family protein [Aquimarina sp. ERC-38]
MIVHTFSDHYKIIFQRSHALLSAQLFCAMQESLIQKVTNYTETLITIASHDDGFTKTSGTYYVTKDGEPKDFRKNRFEKEASIQIIENARLKSTWCYLMALSHMNYLYKEKEDEEIKTFLKYVQEQLQKAIRDYEIDQTSVKQTYEFLRFTDELSLFICFHLFDENQSEKVIKGVFEEENKEYTTSLKARTLYIRPSPFKEGATTTLEYRKIPKISYRDDDHLNKELDRALVKRVEVLLGDRC